jgi:hypothetical protein
MVMTESPRSFQVLRHAQLTARRLVVGKVTWLVYDLPPFTFDRRTSPSLVFEGSDSLCRVRDYPADWRSLSDEDLLTLSWKA